MKDIEPIIASVKAEAAKIDQYMRKDLDALAPDIDGLLYRVLEYGLFNGGKRIRPLLVVLSARLCGSNRENAYKLGCAFEYLHAATLFHDDIIDNSAIRRGKQSVYKKFGTVAAILAGDFLHAFAMEIVGKYCGSDGLKIFCNATRGMVDGEFMQLRNADKHNLSELDYHDAIMGKTGLLIAGACEVGAIYGGGDTKSISALREYGVNLGCAFQIIDDLLDYQGDPGITGKAVGNDFFEGKMTLPLILTINDAEEREKSRLLDLLKRRKTEKNSFKEVYGTITRYRGFEKAKDKAVAAVDNAFDALSIFEKNDVLAERSVLEGLARYVLIRKK